MIMYLWSDIYTNLKYEIANRMSNIMCRARSVCLFTKVVQIPWVYPDMEENGTPKLDSNGRQIYTGYCMEFLHEMSKLMNFDYDVILPTDGCKCFGEKLGDGTWTGLIGTLRYTIILSL